VLAGKIVSDRFSKSLIWTILSSMSPEPELPWYQFSLRSLFLLTAFVAVLCSIGIRKDWSVSAVIAVGGVAGGIVARRWLGLVIGAVSGSLFSILAAFVCPFVWFLFHRMPRMWFPSWQFFAAMKIAAIIGSLIGGVLAGFAARSRSKR
jgi:hypothetical protein